MQAFGQQDVKAQVQTQLSPHLSPSDGQHHHRHATTTKTNTTSSWSHMVAGASGGLVTAALLSPLDVLRTRLQSDFYHSRFKTTSSPQPHLPVYRTFARHFGETFDILFSIHRVEGWRSLFRGLGPSLTGVVPAAAVKFYTYGNCKRLFPELLGRGPDDTLVHALSAATAGLVTGTATNPIWFVKTRLQLDKAQSTGTRQYRNSVDVVRQVLRKEGIRGLYRGLSASYLGAIETTLHLASYERFKGSINAWGSADTQNKSQLAGLSHGAALSGAAGLSKLLAVLVAYPHEVIRTRLRQAPMANGRPKYTGVIQCLRLLCKEEGMAAMYGGLTAHLIRTVPSAAITLGTYELVLRLLNDQDS